MRKTLLLVLTAAGLVAAQEANIPSAMSVQSLLSAPISPLTSLVGIESPIISEKYVLMPGDRLLVTIGGSVAYSYQALITYEGKITLNMPTSLFNSSTAGSINVDAVDVINISGLTLRAAQDTLTAAMGRYFRSVTVKLTLTGLRSAIVFVTGEVQYPGAYNTSPVERVSQVVAKAGGLSPLGSKTRINLVRNGRLQALVDIERFENQGDLAANPFVESGDVIYVPPVEGLVTVRGAVFGRGEYRIRTSALTTEKERASEGIYELKPGERVFDIIRKAGGITPWADLSRSYVDRLVLGGAGARRRIPVDLHQVIFGGDTTQNLLMENADLLVVPPANNTVYVEGEVTKPGAFPYIPNQRASDYIGQAGGPTGYGVLGSGFIIRDRRRISIRPDPIIEPGDIVFVPRVSVRWWQDYVAILSAIGIPVASILVTLVLSSYVP